MSSIIGDHENEHQSSATKRVNLVTSGAILLSGRSLTDCQTPDDESCSGGIAAVSAMSRFYAAQGEGEEDAEVFLYQRFDKTSPFVNMHPLQWVVNRLIMSDIFHLPVFLEAPSILNQNKVDSNVSQRDISGLQSADMQLLLSNVAVPPTNSWHSFVKRVHFDEATGLAIVAIIDNGVPFTVDHIDTAKAVLNYIELVNKRNGCFEEPTAYQEYILQTPGLGLLDGQGQVVVVVNSNNATGVNVTIGNATIDNATAVPTIEETEDDYETEAENNDDNNKQCWIPAFIFSSIEDTYWPLLEAVSTHTYRPQLFVTLDTVYETFPTPQLYKDSGIWVGSCGMNTVRYCQYSMDIASREAENGTREKMIQNVTLIEDDIRNVNETMKDSIWDSHIEKLSILANDARLNDPVIGETDFIPVMRTGSYRACKAGECPVGNLFTDALRWHSKTDVAFTSSGGYRGPGKEAGPARFGDLYAALPFPNTVCLGTMTGISLFRLMNYTTSVSTFEGEDTDQGGRLLQLSGMKITYNTELEGSRLVAIDIWNDETESYEPVDRLQLYTFATDSYICGGYDPYPDLTGPDLQLPGEIPGHIGDILHHNVVADYLTQLGEPYDTSVQGRLRNDTSATEFLNLVETEETCAIGSIWNQDTVSCISCPQYENVKFSDELLSFEDSQDSGRSQSGRVLLLNREPFPVEVRPSSLPRWVDLVTASVNEGQLPRPTTASKIFLEPGDSLVLGFEIQPSVVVGERGDRTALGAVTFGVEDGGLYPGCTSPTNPSFDVMLRIAPPDDYNYLGNIRYVGFSLSAIVYITSLVYVGWVYHRRFSRIVKVLQPIFLYTVCVGVFVMASSMIPMSFDDEIISVRGCGIACMSVPWLLSMGFTISFSALYAKLLRINRLFNRGNFRRITVASKDVMAPFAVLFTLNFAILLVWTLVDPLRWERVAIDDQDWNTVGGCWGGTVSKIMLSAIVCVNLGSLVLACIEAFKARNISDEFSESKYIGVAVYGWLQIIVVAIPVLFLIDSDNNTARYFLQVILIFVLSLSMLLIVSLPAFMNSINQIGQSIKNLRVSGIMLPRQQSSSRSRFRDSLMGSQGLRSMATGGVVSSFVSQPIPEEDVESSDICIHKPVSSADLDLVSNESTTS